MDILDHNPHWAWHPARQEQESGYTLFRRVVDCPAPAVYHLAVSGDNRFNFYLDGKLLGRGPLRGDLDHYFYDIYQGELAPGRHIFAAEVIVWRGGWRSSTAPWAEMHAGGGFMVAGFAGDERLEMPNKWLCTIDQGRRPLAWKESWDCRTLAPAPPMDEIDFACCQSDWLTSENPAGEWVTPCLIGQAEFKNHYQNDPKTPWNLMPRTLKAMTETFTPIAEILETAGNLHLENGRLKGDIQAGKHTILLDVGRNQTSIVRLSGASGLGSCRLAYGETLYDEAGNKVRRYPGTLGQRGYADKLHFAGTSWQYTSFWYRTGRFIELELELEQAIANIDLGLDFITYPMGGFKEFHCPEDPVLEDIYQVACHTLACCAHESFEDCPYYEQMQYIGDSRIEALAAYAATGNDDLGRHALKMIAISQLASGLTQSRYPSVFKQVIPGYCLIGALMLADHYRYFHDLDLVRELLPSNEFMLDAFERKRRSDGLIGPLPGWHYTDWVAAWCSGASDRGQDVPETILNLFYIEACKQIAQLEAAVGNIPQTENLRRRAKQTLAAVNAHCFDREQNRYLDSPGKAEWLSMHANVLAVLFGAVPEDKCSDFLREICADKRLQPMTLYFSFYLLAALKKYGTPEELRQHYAPWIAMLEVGSTTFPERPGKARSECHAWSCAPICFLLQD